MHKRIFPLLISVVILVGVIIGYLAAKDFRNEVTPVYATISFVLVATGVSFLVRSYFTARAKTKKLSAEQAAQIQPQQPKPDHINLLEENNKLIEEWNDIDEKREKLKLLQMADQ